MNGMRINKNILEINTHVNDVEFYTQENGILISVTCRSDTADDILKAIRKVNPADEPPAQPSGDHLMSFKEYLKQNNF